MHLPVAMKVSTAVRPRSEPKPRIVRFLAIRPETILKIAKQRLPDETLPEIIWKQALSEARFVLREGLTFRKRENLKAQRAYSEMDVDEFEAINARQRWANWRTIPQVLNAGLPNRPLKAIDLCCGSGQSTEVLACYLPVGSKVLGIDSSPTFVERAEQRTYSHRSGKSVNVSFRIQSVLESLRDASGNRIQDASIDLVSSSGAVGSHFDEDTTRVLAKEVSRVLRKGGVAAIDSGRPGTKTKTLIRIFQDEGFGVSHTARSSVFDRYTQVCLRKW